MFKSEGEAILALRCLGWFRRSTFIAWSAEFSWFIHDPWDISFFPCPQLGSWDH